MPLKDLILRGLVWFLKRESKGILNVVSRKIAEGTPIAKEKQSEAGKLKQKSAKAEVNIRNEIARSGLLIELSAPLKVLSLPSN